MRTKLVVGNWKMNLTHSEALACVDAFVRLLNQKQSVDIGIAPPYLSIEAVRKSLKHSHMQVGAQDVFWKTHGAFTGRISAAMLLDAGVSFCLVGHSETRGRFGKLEVPETMVGYFGETDETVNLKIQALLFQSITPILCVGETLAERESGATDSVIRGQLIGALAGVEAPEFYTGVVAYEPVWAIGTGQTCDTAEAERVCGMIRSTLADIFGPETAETIRILYGGSVKAANAGELFAQPNIDGGLVGGASLDPIEFSKIVLSA